MRSFIAGVVLLLWCGDALADFTGKVVGVTDGDTITVLRDGRERVKIRLDGIDAPEKSQPHRNGAKQFTSKACFGKTVTVVEKDTDRYGRTIGVVEVAGENVNLGVVQAGYAWWYRKYAPGNERVETLIEPVSMGGA